MSQAQTTNPKMLKTNEHGNTSWTHSSKHPFKTYNTAVLNLNGDITPETLRCVWPKRLESCILHQPELCHFSGRYSCIIVIEHYMVQKVISFLLTIVQITPTLRLKCILVMTNRTEVYLWSGQRHGCVLRAHIEGHALGCTEAAVVGGHQVKEVSGRRLGGCGHGGGWSGHITEEIWDDRRSRDSRRTGGGEGVPVTKLTVTSRQRTWGDGEPLNKSHIYILGM